MWAIRLDLFDFVRSGLKGNARVNQIAQLINCMFVSIYQSSFFSVYSHLRKKKQNCRGIFYTNGRREATRFTDCNANVWSNDMQHSKKSNRFHRIHRTGYDQNLGRFHPYAGINHLYRVQLHSMEATRCTTANCKLTHTHTPKLYRPVS